jgi:hypothetical protein
MTNWEIYVQQSYDLVKRAESELTITLEHELEAYLVHLFAKYLDKPMVNTEPVCIKLLESNTKPKVLRKRILQSVGDECLLIHSMEWGKSRWPATDYYQTLGQSAYATRAYLDIPAEVLFDELAADFQLATKILGKCRNS